MSELYDTFVKLFESQSDELEGIKGKLAVAMRLLGEHKEKTLEKKLENHAAVNGRELLSGVKPVGKDLALMVDDLSENVSVSASGEKCDHEGSESSGGSLRMPQGLSSHLGVGESVSVKVPQLGVDISAGGFFQRCVRTPRVEALASLLREITGVKMPRSSYEELALASFTTATVPSDFVDGAKRIRGLAAIGDAALSLAVVATLYRNGETVQNVQYVRSGVLSNAVMSKACCASGLSAHIIYPNGVHPSSSKLSADALEAVAGVLSLWMSPVAVHKYAVWLQMI